MSNTIFEDVQPPSLILHDFQIIKRTKHVDIYRIEFDHPFRFLAVVIAVKVPRAPARCLILRARLNEALSRIKATLAASDYDAAKVCPVLVVNVSTEAGIVKACVQPWFENGNVLDYVRTHPEANKARIIKDLAQAIQHVHSKGRTVGNVHPSNVMITAEGRAVLGDVGMTALTNLNETDRVRVPEMWVYKSPEELLPPNDNDNGVVVHSAAMDVYSFATTSYAIFSGAPLVSRSLGDLVRICEDAHSHLERPMGMDMTLWIILRQCLERDPADRPTMMAVVSALNG